jgi:hypothetical protein
MAICAAGKTEPESQETGKNPRWFADGARLEPVANALQMRKSGFWLARPKF